jgi:hypothetical protein
MDSKMTAAAAILLTVLPLSAHGALVTRIVAVQAPQTFSRLQALESDPAESDPCVVADKTLYVLENAIVETAARDWAYRMRQPGYSSRSAALHPSVEITHPEVKSRFQERLAFWSSMEFVSRPSAEALTRAKEISKNIRLVKALRGQGGALKCSEARLS